MYGSKSKSANKAFGVKVLSKEINDQLMLHGVIELKFSVAEAFNDQY